MGSSLIKSGSSLNIHIQQNSCALEGRRARVRVGARLNIKRTINPGSDGPYRMFGEAKPSGRKTFRSMMEAQPIVGIGDWSLAISTLCSPEIQTVWRLDHPMPVEMEFQGVRDAGVGTTGA